MRLVSAIKPLLVEFDEQVFKMAVKSIALFCWAHDQPEEAPSIEFLLHKTQDRFGLKPKNEIPANEAAWNALLDAYGYTWTDDFDQELIRDIRAGYFKPDEIRKRARVLHERALATKAGGSFEDAWRLYHDSFMNNQDEVLDAIFTSFMQNMKYIHPLNLNGTVTLFKELGRPEQAREMIEHYVTAREEQRAFYDLDNDPFGRDVDDPDIRAAFNQKFKELEENRDVTAMLTSLKGNWSPEVIAALASLPVEEYQKVFKSTSGDQLRRILSNIFEFDRVANATEEMKEIPRRARMALKLIGAESAINRRRVSRFGVKVDDESTEPGGSGSKG
jgi:hypothetical protein